jgi:YHS domain-containing protein
MMRFLFARVIVPLLIVWFLRGILKSFFGGSPTQVTPRPIRPVPTTASPGGELKKDPVCGTYVSVDTAVTRRVNGQVVHFCSPACRDKFQTA